MEGSLLSIERGEKADQLAGKIFTIFIFLNVFIFIFFFRFT